MRKEVALSLEVKPSADGSLPREFRIFQAGMNDTVKGKFLFDDKAASSVMSSFRSRGVDAWMDYNHHTLKPPSDGAKAAAWLAYEVRNGELWATNVRWTPPAEKALTNKEFRYFSPAFYVDDDGRITEMRNLALENDPAMHNLDPLVAATAREEILPKETVMKTVLVALGLKDTDDEGKALDAVQTLRDNQREVIALSGKGSHAEAMGEIHAWKDSHGKVVALMAEQAKERAEAEAKEFNAIIEQAGKDGKIPPAADDERRIFALSLRDRADGLTVLKGYVKALPALIAASPAVPEKQADPVALTAAEIKVAKQMGVDIEALAKNKARRLQMISSAASEGE